MKENYKFLKELMKSPQSIGAIFPSTKFLSKQMLKNINFDKDINIIEYGPGTGVFTKNIIERMSKESRLIIIENNIYFYQILQEKYRHFKNVSVLLDSAENVEAIMVEENIEHVDYIISGIPFSSLPKHIRDSILLNTQKVMSESTLFITFQYSNILKKYFSSFFDIKSVDKTLINVPPAIIFNMKLKN